jgi:hypothetical protein
MDQGGLAKYPLKCYTLNGKGVNGVIHNNLITLYPAIRRYGA